MIKLTSYFSEDEIGDILLLNTTYLPCVYGTDENGKMKKIEEDYLYLTYRSISTGVKKMRAIKNPKVDTFIAKPDELIKFRTQRRFLYEDQLDRISVPYNAIVKNIRLQLRNSVDKDMDAMIANCPREVFKWRGAYYSDFNIEDYAFTSYLLNHPKYDENENICKLKFSRAFLDIEADVYGLTTSEMDAGEGPINAVTITAPYDTKANKFEHPQVFTFLLRNHARYKDQKYFEEHLEDFLEQAHSEFDKKYNTPDFHIVIFDYEVDLLKALFVTIHKLNPDFMLVWNLSYDCNKIISRLEYLGEDPVKYFAGKEFERKYIHYNEDHVYTNDFKNRNDSFDCTSQTRWMCQMLLYAGLRKATA